MSNKNIQPWVKTALEMGPVILFFVFYSKFKNNEYIFLGETYEGFMDAVIKTAHKNCNEARAVTLPTSQLT